MKGFKRIGRYVKRVLLGIDQLGNTLIGGAADETISARAGRNIGENGLATALCKVLDTLDKDHCIEAVMVERRQGHQDKSYLIITVDEKGEETVTVVIAPD